MQSPTKVALSAEEIAALARAAFGAGARVTTCAPIDEGWYNAAYALELTGSGPARAFLKVAPPPATPVLSYEDRLMRAETATLVRLAGAGVPRIPAVLASGVGGRVIASDWLITTWADGVMLSEARAGMAEADRVRVRRQIGETCGLASRIEGESFGYPGVAGLQAADWRGTFERMVGALFDDARRFEAPLPQPAEALAARFAAAMPLLDRPCRPCLVHYDLWDNNVLVREGLRGWEVSGIVDWERGFFGDPLADVIALTAVGSPAARAAALAGQAEARGAGHAMDAGDQRRLALYRAYLWLIMIVEAGPRGFSGSIRLPTSAAARRLARDLAAALGA